MNLANECAVVKPELLKISLYPPQHLGRVGVGMFDKGKGGGD